jgi:hypothetical protein
MNNSIRIALATAALGASCTAFGADVQIRITGSTAFRSAVFNALKNDYFDVTPVMVLPGNTGNPSGSSSRITFVGTNSAAFGASTRVIIQCAYSGSVEGIVNVIRTSSSSPVPQPKYVNVNGTDTADNDKDADLAFSDVAQDTTDYPTTTAAIATPFPASGSYPEQGIGVVTFGFAKNNGVNTNTVSNITGDQFQAFAANGSESRGFFNNDKSDTTPVYLFGRYRFSGTRLSVGAVTGLGSSANQSLYSGSDSGFILGSGVTASSGVEGGSVFSDGFVSGGDLGVALGNTAQTNNVIGYLSAGDIRGKNLRNFRLTYNGVALERTNVIAGTYAFWSYEQLYGTVTPRSDVTKFVKGVTSPTVSTSLIKAIDTELKNDLDYVSLGEMKAVRTGDGGLITPNF